jgi:cell division septation protein DedD
MFLRFRLVLATLAILAPTVSRPGIAQGNPAADSVFARARRLVTGGNGAAGRVLVDSMMAAAPPESPAYADALYWRAALAASPRDAERDYRRLVVDYWYGSHAADALLQLAQTETARGDRAAASSHLQRFMLEAPTHPDRPRVGLTLTRLLFDQNDIPRGCVAWRQAMSATPATSVELRNQLAYYSGRCTATDVSAASRVPVAYPPGTPPPAAAPKDTTPRRDTTAASARGRFTLQLAAFNTKTEATRLAARLLTRGITARVVGKAKPFRVRVGRYETRAAAIIAQRDLKAKKLDAVVADIGPDDK